MYVVLLQEVAEDIIHYFTETWRTFRLRGRKLGVSPVSSSCHGRQNVTTMFLQHH